MIRVLLAFSICLLLSSCNSKKSARDIDPEKFESVCDCASALNDLKSEMEAELDKIEDAPSDKQRDSFKELEKKYKSVYSVCLNRYDLSEMKTCSDFPKYD